MAWEDLFEGGGTATRTASAGSGWDSLFETDFTPQRAKIIQYQADAAQMAEEARKANSFKGILKETGRGVVNFGRDILKGTAEFGLSAGEALPRLTAATLNPSLKTKATGSVYVPGLSRVTGPLESFQSKAIRAVEGGESVPKAVGTSVVDTFVNDPLGIALKPIFIGGALGIKAFQTLASKKTAQEVSDILQTSYPGLSKTQIDTISPHIAEVETAGEVEKLIRNVPEARTPSTSVPGETLVETPVQAEARAVSKVAQDLNATAIEKGISESGLTNLAEYTPTSIKEQAEKAADLITNDYEGALRVLGGQEALPGNLRGGTLIKALEDIAVRNGDGELLQKIAQSPLTTETSIAAQELRMLAERAPDSPVVVMKEISETRARAAEARIKNPKAAQAKVVDDIRAEIKKVPPPKNWDEFVDSITC